jgi:hypothetical protein
MPNYSCADAASCTRDNNQGWRYVWYTSGAFVFVLSILRVTVVRLEETPKFLVSEGKDEKVVSVLQNIARKYNRPCSLTVERLSACGVTRTRNSNTSGSKKSWKIISITELTFHLRGLYATRKMGLSTTLIWFSWLLIGLAYPLFNVFLPQYLASRGAQFGEDSPYITWRNYAITNMCGIFGPILAGYMCRSRWFWGRRGTMIIGALVTMVFFFSYTAVRTADQNVAFTCVINFCLNIYYGTLYAYTPEVFTLFSALLFAFQANAVGIGPPLRTSRYRKWNRDRSESDYGNRQCDCRSRGGCTSLPLSFPFLFLV